MEALRSNMRKPDTAVVDMGVRGVKYAQELVEATEHETCLKPGATEIRVAWTVLPRDCCLQVLPKPDREIWDSLGRKITKKEIFASVGSLCKQFIHLARERPECQVYFIDPIYRGKEFELEDGSYLAPRDKQDGRGRCYVLPHSALTLYNVDVLADFCGVWWGGGGFIGECNSLGVMEKVLYFLSAAYDRESYMISSTLSDAVTTE